jgi:hypothetical protein
MRQHRWSASVPFVDGYGEEQDVSLVQAAPMAGDCAGS